MATSRVVRHAGDVGHRVSPVPGVAKVTYKNNSPETLDKVFWHLFFNAFNQEA